MLVQTETTAKKKLVGLFLGGILSGALCHLAVAQTVLDTLQLDRIDFMPGLFAPHVGSEKKRLARSTLEHAHASLADNPRFAIELASCAGKEKVID